MASTVKQILIVLLIFVGCTRGPEDKGLEIFPDMVYSVAYEAYSESDIGPGGGSMLSPPANSIGRGHIPFNYGDGEEEAQRAGEELVNPFKVSDAILVKGKHVYDNYCLVCHGEKGKGDGPLIPKFPNPPSLSSRRIKKYKDGRFYHIITRGFGDMPSHAAQIYPKDRWYLVHYIKTLQGNE